MENVYDEQAPTIEVIDSWWSLFSEVFSEWECKLACNAKPECDHWTQFYGSCFMKKEGAFKQDRKTEGKKWISGSKHCPSAGNRLFI